MKRQMAFSLLQLLIEVAITLFIAGIIVPSFIRSDLATKEALAAGSLRTINIAGIAFSYTHQNVEFAILGALVGAMAALAIDFLATTKPHPRGTTKLACWLGSISELRRRGAMKTWGESTFR